MNWISGFFLGAWGTEGRHDEESEAVVSWRTLLKRVRVRARKALVWARRRPWAVLAASALLLAVIVPLCYPRLRASAKSILGGPLFPAPAAPVLPGFDNEVLGIDPAVAVRRWRYIVIHHSASTRGSAQIFDQAHRDRGWRSLGYHFVIGNGTDQADGVIAPGPRWYSQEAGAHAHSTEHNEYGIGVCLVGNFDAGRPSAAQWAALVTLVTKLSRRFGIGPANIVGHNAIRQGGSTACPGRNFPMLELREAVGR